MRCAAAGIGDRAGCTSPWSATNEDVVMVRRLIATCRDCGHRSEATIPASSDQSADHDNVLVSRRPGTSATGPIPYPCRCAPHGLVRTLWLPVADDIEAR